DAPEPLHVSLPSGLREVIFRCLEKDQKNRPQSVGELARSLAPYSTDPITAAQIAGRATRILQSRGSAPGIGPQGLPISAGGGLATPVPISPAQLTPRSWPPSTSTSQGRGQMTLKTDSGRGWLVAGGVALVLIAGVGGFIFAEMRHKKADDSQT